VNDISKYYRHYNPLERQGESKMMGDCIVLLAWAAEHRNMEASITIIAEETGIPRMTLHWILEDVFDRHERSILSRTARSYNYDFMIYKSWNTTEKYKRKKKIIDAVKCFDVFREKDY
jgi:predicted transposase YbfD/YdcC